MDFSSALAALDREIERARRAMALERAIQAALAAAAALAVWVLAALLGVHAHLAPLLGTIATTAALLGVSGLALYAVLRYRRPTAAEARDRLAIDSGVDRSVFDTLEDRPTRLDPFSIALWRRARHQAAGAAAQARAAGVRWSIVGQRDPFWLRAALPAALMLALVLAGDRAGDRLAAAFFPDPGPLVGDGPIEVEAWLTPAGYTGAAPISLSDRLSQVVETAPASEATVRVTGPASPPRLIFDGAGPARAIRFQKAADGAYEAKIDIAEPGVLRVVRFHTRARWTIKPGPDQPPTARFTAAPQAGAGETLGFAWAAEDDFGVRSVALRITPAAPPPGLVGAPPIDIPVPAPAGDLKSAEGRATVNVAENPYAGMLVEARIVALDAADGAGVSAPVTLRLPERVFLQPLARAAIEIRRLILHERRSYAAEERRDDAFWPEEDQLARAPKAIRRAGVMIDSLTVAPQDGFFSDLAVYAGFRLARAQLDVARSIDETNRAASVLWQVAMRAEYGDSADARTALEQAQKALSEALRSGADQETVARLAEAYARAMQDYLAALTQEAVREGRWAETNEDAMSEPDSLSAGDMAQMLDEVQERAAAGDAMAAEQLLQRLTALLGQIEVQLTEGEPQAGDGENAMEQVLDRLSDQIGEQKAIQNETQRAANGDGDVGDARARQEQLAEALKETQRAAERQGAGDGAQQLGSAADAAARAARRLAEGDAAGAAAEQDEALRQMRNGADQLARQAGKEGAEQGQRGDDGGRDPLGRAPGAPVDDGTRVPTEVERLRAREILDELRRRAQDPNRPQAERDYLRRLLDRFTDS